MYKKTLYGALEQMMAGGQPGNYHYPKIKNGPVEVVLGFNNDEFIRLLNPDNEFDPADPNGPHFSSRGKLTDLQGNPIPDSKVETTFPVDPAQFPLAFSWPDQQKPDKDGHFYTPPVDYINTTGNGYSKQAYFFNNGEDYIVTVGPSLPKISLLKNGGAQFWVASIGVVSQGKGIYEGAHGTSVYIGSAYLSNFPKDWAEQKKLLVKGFDAKIGTYFKLTLKADVG